MIKIKTRLTMCSIGSLIPRTLFTPPKDHEVFLLVVHDGDMVTAVSLATGLIRSFPGSLLAESLGRFDGCEEVKCYV